MEKKSAKIENGVVTNVIVGDIDWAKSHLGGEWIDVTGTKCSKGWTYTEEEGLRINQPFPSWSWNGSSWEAPVPRPLGGFWIWNEETQQWQDHY